MMTNAQNHYSLIIQWSDIDNCFVVSFPEWGNFCHTHGDTYEEALQQGKELLDFLIESTLEEGKTLPIPHAFQQSLVAA
jgi:predicted RNase H-like HicB family nuclease